MGRGMVWRTRHKAGMAIMRFAISEETRLPAGPILEKKETGSKKQNLGHSDGNALKESDGKGR